MKVQSACLPVHNNPKEFGNLRKQREGGRRREGREGEPTLQARRLDDAVTVHDSGQSAARWITLDQSEGKRDDDVIKLGL